MEPKSNPSESRMKTQFIHRLNQDTNIMAQDLAQNLIHLSYGSLGANRATELHLNHRKDCFHVRPLMVMLQKGFPIEVVEVPHLVPETVELTPHASCPLFEGNVGCTAYAIYNSKVLLARVCFISRHFTDREISGGVFDQSFKLRSISRLSRSHFNAGDDLRFHAAYKVCFDPLVFLFDFPILLVIPTVICACGKARGINGEVSFHSSKREGTLLNHSLQNGGKQWVFKVSEYAVVMGGFRDIPFELAILQIASDTPARYSRVHLERCTENNIGERQSRSAECLYWLHDAFAKLVKKLCKPLRLMGLSFVVSRPILGACELDRFRVGHGAVRFSLPLNRVFNGMYMLAVLLPFLEIWTGAKRLAVVKIHNISSIARLGGYFPAELVLLNLAQCRYSESSFLSCFHRIHLSLLVYTNSIYHQGLTCQYFWYILLVKYVNILRGGTWQKQQRELAESCLRAIGVGVGMSGFHATKEIDLGFAPNAKALTGIDLSSSVGQRG